MKKYYYVLLFLSLISCSIEEGEGGKGEISGKVMIQEIVDFSITGGPKDSVVNEYPAIDHRVYIKYGDNKTYDDDFDTDENGYFKFIQLTKGDYKLFTYTKCDTCDSEVSPVYQSVNLKKHSSKIDNITLFIEKD